MNLRFMYDLARSRKGVYFEMKVFLNPYYFYSKKQNFSSIWNSMIEEYILVGKHWDL